LFRLPLHYPNLVLFLFSIGLTIILARLGFFQFLVHLPSLGYLGAFISGLLLPFTFAAPLATAGFFYLGALDNFWLVALLGIAILAYYRVRPVRFVSLSFLLNSLGIWLVVGIGYMAFH